MSKELLKSMLQNIINDNHEQASTELHQYIVTKSRPVVGIAEDEYQEDDDEDTVEFRVESHDDSDLKEHDIISALDKVGYDPQDVNVKGVRAYFTINGYRKGQHLEDDIADALEDIGTVTML